MAPTDILIYGGGGFGREVAWLVDVCGAASYRVVGFIEDNADRHGELMNGIPLMGLEDAYARHPQARVVGAVGSPQVREKLVNRAAEIGFEFETIIHPNVEQSPWVEIGTGTVICSTTILTTNITLGEHVQINLGCTIGHDAILGDYATLAPGVHVSGWVFVGKRAYIGTGAVIINGTQDKPLIIGDDAIVGASACVVKSVEPSTTVVGVPAKSITKRA